MSNGRIWPEYWIDCKKCDEHEPLAETDIWKAREAALERGWKQDTYGRWVCARCRAKKVA